MAGMRDIIEGRRILVRHLRDTACHDGVGHWVPEGRGDAVNDALLTIRADVAHCLRLGGHTIHVGSSRSWKRPTCAAMWKFGRKGALRSFAAAPTSGGIATQAVMPQDQPFCPVRGSPERPCHG